MKALPIFCIVTALFWVGCTPPAPREQSKTSNTSGEFTIAFYNVENLFDTEDSPHFLDDEFTPNGNKKWTKKRYHKKIKLLAETIGQIGVKDVNSPPSLIGLAEVENERVLKDLINSKPLKNLQYSYVHYDSEDARGIDVALLYRTNTFTLKSSKPIRIEKLRTRDILKVIGEIEGVPIEIYVNHWPSRRGGVKQTESKRILVAKYLKNDLEQGTDIPTIVMGDFNDTPNNPSIYRTLNTENNLNNLSDGELYNPWGNLVKKKKGTLIYQHKWYLFDQILSDRKFNSKEGFTIESFDIYSAPELLQEGAGKYTGYPDRTYAGPRYLGGESDHLPVYITVSKN